MGEKNRQNISDEMIMAFVDGELDAGQTKIVEHVLETDPALQEKAAMFSETTSMLAGVYDGPLHEEVPECLVRTVQKYSREESWFARFAEKFRQMLCFSAMRPAPAFALITLLIISGGFFYHFSAGSNGYPKFVLDASFAQGLDTMLPGHVFAVNNASVQVSPVVTFTDKENRYCRRFDVLDQVDNNQIIGRGIACREKTKQWRTIAYQQIPEKGLTPSARSSFELAGSSNPVDSVMNKEARTLLSDQQVRALIKNGWSDSP